MSEYLTLLDAKAVIDASVGSRDFLPSSHREPWVMSNLPLAVRDDPLSYLGIGIEKVDDLDAYDDLSGAIPFDWDDDAWRHVRTRAEDGSDLHRRAMELHHAANSLRYHLWGAQWIDSRIGPPAIGQA